MHFKMQLHSTFILYIIFILHVDDYFLKACIYIFRSHRVNYVRVLIDVQQLSESMLERKHN